MEKQWTCDEDILCGINKPKDASALSDLEKKHTPVITAPAAAKKDEAFDVTVEVGKLLAHPNEPGHFIEWIELYCGDTFLFRVSLAAVQDTPKVTIPIKLSHAHGPFKARVKCNLHGLWEAVKNITIT